MPAKNGFAGMARSYKRQRFYEVKRGKYGE